MYFMTKYELTRSPSIVKFFSIRKLRAVKIYTYRIREFAECIDNSDSLIEQIKAQLCIL